MAGYRFRERHGQIDRYLRSVRDGQLIADRLYIIPARWEASGFVSINVYRTFRKTMFGRPEIDLL